MSGTCYSVFHLALNFLSLHAAFIQAKLGDLQNWHNSKESAWPEGVDGTPVREGVCVGRGLIGGRDSDVIQLAASFSSCDTGSRRWRS